MKNFSACDVIMAIPLGILLLACIVGVIGMTLRLFSESTWAEVLTGLLALWLTVSVLYFIVIKGIS